ncbi:MAG: hypothetical protein JXA96_00505 [Sedimentisphaerales bacterium]|nr:hypothetical protein [Sedimentisphaerales bacterium]
MAKGNDKNANQLPDSAMQFIKHVIKKVRYRKMVRADVQAELLTHFEDELQDCNTEQERLEKANHLIEEFGDIKLLATLIRRAKKRCRPLWKKVLIRATQGVGIIFLYIFICTLPLMIGKPTIKVDYLQYLNENEKAGREDSENARVYYEKAAELLVPMPDWLIPNNFDWPSDFNEVELKKLSDWLEKNKEPLEILREAANKYSFWSHYQKSTDKGILAETIQPSITEPLPDYRHLAFAMSDNIRYEAWQGDVNQAMEDCFTIMKMGYNIGGQGFLVEQLVGIALEAVGFGECFRLLDKVDIPAEVLQSTQEKLNKLYAERKPVCSLESEKIYWDDLIQNSFTDDGNGDGRPVNWRGFAYTVESDWTVLKLLTFDYPSRKEITEAVERHFDMSAELMAESPLKLHEEGIDPNNWITDFNEAPIMLEINDSAYCRVHSIGWRLKTDRHALLTVLALFRYFTVEGNFPKELNELVQGGYIKELPLDSYSNKPLVYIPDNEGDFMLYSVGSNFTDDGGTIGTNSQGKRRVKYEDNGDWIYWPLIELEK